jgi:hypothetical protein
MKIKPPRPQVHKSLNRHINGNVSTIEVEVQKTNNAHVVLSSKELGEIYWPLSKGPKELKDGEILELKLGRSNEKNGGSENEIAQLRQLLEELVM